MTKLKRFCRTSQNFDKEKFEIFLIKSHKISQVQDEGLMDWHLKVALLLTFSSNIRKHSSQFLTLNRCGQRVKQRTSRELTTDPGSEDKTWSTLKQHKYSTILIHIQTQHFQNNILKTFNQIYTFKLKLILISIQSKQHIENIKPNSYTFKLKFIQHFNKKNSTKLIYIYTKRIKKTKFIHNL